MPATIRVTEASNSTGIRRSLHGTKIVAFLMDTFGRIEQMTVSGSSPISQAMQDSVVALQFKEKVAVLNVRKEQTDFYQKLITGTVDPVAPVYDSGGKTVTQSPPAVDVTV